MDHVVIAGAGRVGRGVSDALAQLKLPFVLIESDDRRVRQARDAQLSVIYGDASQGTVLEAAGIGHARAVLVTVPAFADVRNIFTEVRRLQPEIPVIARADGTEAVRALYTLGVQEVTSPEFEAAIEMTRQALLYFHVPAHEVLQVASAIRRERYDAVAERQNSGFSIMANIGDLGRQLDFTWIGLLPGSPLDGRSLSDLRVRTTTGASVVGIIRDNNLMTNPDGEARLATGDLVAVVGTRDQVARFQHTARGDAATSP